MGKSIDFGKDKRRKRVEKERRQWSLRRSASYASPVVEASHMRTREERFRLFSRGDKVTNGKLRGEIVEKHEKRFQLEVQIEGTRRVEYWAPDFVEKI